MKLLNVCVLIALFCLPIMGCNRGMTDAQFSEKMAKVLKDDPKILAEAVKAHPDTFMDALQDAAKSAQEGMAKKRADEEKKQLEDSFNNPLKPLFRNDESFRGNKDGVITLVEYSDFQCPYCTRGYKTVMELLKKYEGKIRFVYKHLPLSFHDQAMITAKYYEAIRLQDANKAFKFHDEIFENQSKLSNGEAFLKSVAAKVGANMTKLAKDIKSKEVEDRIAQDQKEAGEFGMQGTPGFLINGVPVRGAYPADYLTNIVDELVKRGKLQI